MKALFFDTETNGLPKNYKASYSDLKNWPRVIQLAWQLIDCETEKVIRQGCSLVKPDKWKIPNHPVHGKFWIENGYSTEKNMAEGKPAKILLQDLADAMAEADFLVAHNVTFDTPIVAAEMIRYAVKSGKRLPKYCTMQASTAFCAIPHANGKGHKWPKLIELHKKLFKVEFDGAHDALADVSACAKCFFELVRLKVLIVAEWQPVA